MSPETRRRTRIIATLGPASSSSAIIEALIRAGVDCFRLNMSHGTHEEHRTLATRVRRISRRLQRHVALLFDLCGPKIRTGRFRDGGIDLQDGARADTELAIALEADFLALSFVRERRDLEPLYRHLKRRGTDIPVIAKIEKPEALEHIEDILEHSYGIMIARGDLGIEIPAERVPLVQEQLIDLARRRNRPVIVATQMMESMIGNPRPTRAEVADVAIAAESSTDCVMLSGETAVGRFPVETVQTMERILLEVERHQARQGRFCADCPVDLHHARLPVREAVSNAVLSLARDLTLGAIVVPTRGGTTARVIAPIHAVSSDPRTLRRTALHWGLHPVQVAQTHIRDWRRLLAHLVRHHHCRSGATALVVSGFHDDPALNEPAMKILPLP